MTTYHCSIDGCKFTTHSALGVRSHSRKHKRQYRDITGEYPDDYDEVREVVGGKVYGDGDLIQHRSQDSEPVGEQIKLQDALNSADA